MARKGKKHVCPTGIASWVLTYGDLMSLLLVFFILLFSFASVDSTKFSQIVVSLQGALGVLSGGQSIFNDGSTPLSNISKGDSFLVSMEGLQKEIMDVLQASGSNGMIQASYDTRGLVVSLAGDVVFGPDSARLKPAAKKVLSKLIELIRAFPNEIAIEGHTSNRPTSGYGSHWELSALRAVSVAAFITRLAPEVAPRITVSGYGFYRPKVSNSTDIGQVRNRRVELIFFRYRKKESK